MNFIDRKKDAIITCPFCGREYLPAEIYIPDQFFGMPEDIDRDVAGKIEIYDGSTMDLNEEYTCDCCGKKFDIQADLKFKTAMSQAESFSDTYSTLLQSNRISLFEGIEDLVNNDQN